MFCSPNEVILLLVSSFGATSPNAVSGVPTGESELFADLYSLLHPGSASHEDASLVATPQTVLKVRSGELRHWLLSHVN